MKPDFGKELRELELKRYKEYEKLNIKQFITNTVYSRTKLVPDLVVTFSNPNMPPRIRFKASTRYDCQTITLKDVYKLYKKFPPLQQGYEEPSLRKMWHYAKDSPPFEKKLKEIHPVTFQIHNYTFCQNALVYLDTKQAVRNLHR